MDLFSNPDLRLIVIVVVALLGTGLLFTLALLGWVVWRIKRIQLPPDADFLTTLQATPLEVAILLDLLDFTLDFLSAPIAWTLLSYLGLKALRGVTVVESLIPGTQILPTMTLAWLVARFLPPERNPWNPF
jgi:hypothetical protein